MEVGFVNFADVVRSTPEIAECLKNGLQALGGNSRKIKGTSTHSLKGSVDIDTCLKRIYPNDPRWDYVFGYKDRVYYVEVHQGRVSEVENVIRKFNWLKQWRARSATNLEGMKDQSSYHWISTRGTDSIQKRSRHRRMLDQNGIYGPSSGLKPDTIP